MINYNYYDLYMSDIYCDILKYLGGVAPTDEEVWEVARQSEEIPVFENILYSMTLSRIEDKLAVKYPDVSIKWYVNSRDTHLYINTKEVCNLDTFKTIMEEMK